MTTPTYPVCLNPERHTWDFWYHYDAASGLFHLIYLNAPRSLVPAGEHHGAARLGYATTRDFVTIDWIDDDVFQADPDGWDNTSIWSGDLIKTASGYALFYTSRDRRQDDGLTQQVGLAVSPNLIDWQRVESFRLAADPRWYDVCSNPEDNTIHAWRDPFLFIHDDVPHMLIAAKTHHQPLSRRGAVALLRSQDGGLLNWQPCAPAADPGWYSEMEVPHLLQDQQGQPWLAFSGWAKHDHSPFTAQAGGLQAIRLFSGADAGRVDVKVLLPETSGLYACRVIPELDGEIVGFDVEQGGIRRSGVKVSLAAVDRDFSGYLIE